MRSTVLGTGATKTSKTLSLSLKKAKSSGTKKYTKPTPKGSRMSAMTEIHGKQPRNGEVREDFQAKGMVGMSSG